MTIAELFATLPTRFKADKAANYSGIFHFDLTDSGSGAYTCTVQIQRGDCAITEGLHGEATCVIRATVKDYKDIELGYATPQEYLMKGRLHISNLMEMLQFGSFFRKYTPPVSGELKGTATRKPTTGPLQGLRILDLTRLLPGPLCTMMLADMGAEVIKIEAPNFYDYTRDFPPHIGGESIGYLAFNRSKRNLCIDYNNPEGKAIFMDLVREADVVMEQFRPGVMDKMGLGYEHLRQVNPRIIYVSITGYGQTGPYAHLAGHDLNYITLGGLLAGNAHSAPQLPMIQIADIAGGSYMAAMGTLAAVYARERTGEGQWVDVGMMDGAMPLAINAQAGYLLAGEAVSRDEMFLSGGLVNYDIYPAQDGRYVALGALEAKFWERFCEVVGKPEWKNRITYQNREELAQYKQELTALFQSQPAAYWHELGIKHDLLLNLVYDLPDVAQDPHVQAREMIITQEHPKAGTIRTIGVPVKFSATKASPAWSPARLGEDTLAILQEAGLTTEQINALHQRGLIKGL